MIDIKILKRAILVGILAQLILVGIGHAWPRLRADISLLFGFMMITGVAGLLYARDLGRGYGPGALGGGAVGATSALAAVGVSSLLGDHPELYLPYGVMLGAVTGAVGGLFGQMDARIRAMIASLKN